MRPALIAPAVIELDPQSEPCLTGDAWKGYEPPLGILTVASALRAGGVEPVVFDLDGFLRQFLADGGDLGAAFDSAVSAIASLDAELFGFGTICCSYPATIRLATQLHRLRPEVRIVLGGPQASAVDVRTMEEFPFIDAVVRGEADQIIARAFEQLAAGHIVEAPGVTYRRGGRITRNLDAPVVLDLDAVPAPAFDLCGHAARCTRLPVEIGRGCPFACTFCSTNDFFRRRFRLRSPDRVLREMRRLELLFGVTDFDLVHDMFTVDRKRVVEFCRFMEAGRSLYTWHCSARTDFVDRELIGIMRDAGCRSLFFGVETGSARLQKIIGKDLGIEQAAEAIELAEKASVECTVSLIVGFPEETIGDLDATASFALDAARFDTAKVQIGLLAPLAGTPVYRKWRDQLVFDDFIPEQSRQSWSQDPADMALVEQYPDLFSSFYGLPAGVGREYAGEFRWFFKYGLQRCRWLMIALGSSVESFAKIYDAWLARRPAGSCTSGYYSRFEFAEDLCHFAMESPGRDGFASGAVEMMALYYGSMHAVLHENEREAIGGKNEWPRIRPNLTIVDLPFRPARVIDALRRKRLLDEQCSEPAGLVVRREGNRIADVREVPAFAAAVLRLCDGNTSVAQMARVLGSSCPAVPGVGAEDFLAAGLESLGDHGLIDAAGFRSLAAVAN
jgi:radical SAM superfamily enzyme YgiQ (UPF0313 family)